MSQEGLRGVAAGLLLIGGAISVPEARELAGLDPLTEKQRSGYKQMYAWCRGTGVPMIQSRPDYWRWSAFWETDDE